MDSTKDNVKFCNQMIERLQGLRFFNTLTPVAVQILSDTLLSTCKSRAQAELLVNGWIAEHSEFPTPADINTAARSMNRIVNEYKSFPPPCELCQEVPGYVRVDCTVQSGVFAGEKRSAMALCSCERGQALMNEKPNKENQPTREPPDMTAIGTMLQ